MQLRLGLGGTIVLAVLFTATAAVGLPDQQPSSGRVFVSPAGDDSNPCTREMPCLSWNRGYRLARPGDVVELAGGTYAPQRIELDPAKRGKRRVTFAPAVDAAVIVQRAIDFGRGSRAVSNVAVRNVAVAGELRAWAGSSNLLWENLDAESFLIDGASKVTVRGGDFGPCRAGPGVGCVSKVAGATARDILIEGALFHDITSSDPVRFHIECMFLRGGVNVVIRGSRFVNCEVFDIFLQGQPEVSSLSEITIENNWFDAPLKGDGTRRDTAIAFSGGKPYRNVVIKNNSFVESGVIFTDQMGSSGYSNTRLVNNILRRGLAGPVCHRAVTIRVNVLERGLRCSAAERSAPFGYDVLRGALVIDGREARSVRRAFTELVRRKTTKAAIQALRRSRVAAPGGRWSGEALRRLVRDRAYLGSLYGAKGSHPPIVSRRLWNAAQRASRR